jgi:hypothetical protein
MQKLTKVFLFLFKDAEAENLDKLNSKLNRLDILLNGIVDFPRKCIQLYESYSKLLEENSEEYQNLKGI